MAAVFGREQIGVRVIGSTVTVPNDHRARLMYYLNCIGSLLDLRNNETQRKFQDYQNYWRIQSLEDKKTLLYLCALLSPDELDNKCIFHSEDIDNENKFFEIKKVSHLFGVTESVLIGGQRTQVTQIMVYKMSWIRSYFMEPIMELKRECERLDRPTPRVEYRRSPQPFIRSPQPTRQALSTDEGCCCTIL